MKDIEESPPEYPPMDLKTQLVLKGILLLLGRWHPLEAMSQACGM